MARKKKETVRDKYDHWLMSHPALACLIVGASAFAALVGLYAFVTFSGFGSSADFIYNQF